MSEKALNQTWRQQQARLVKATFKKGFINAVYISSGTVDVYYAENPQTIIRNIPVATHITLSSALVGKRCRIDLFDETNPSDSVLAYTY